MTINAILARLARVAAAPVVRATPLFMLVFVMDCAVNCWYIVSEPALGINAVNAVLQCCRGFVLAWLAGGVWLLARRAGRVAAGVWSVAVVVGLLVSALFDVVIYEVYHTTFTVEHTAILLATNPGEASDFVDTYFSARLLGVMASMVAVFALAWMAGVWLGRNLRVTPPKFNRRLQYLTVVVLSGCLVLSVALRDKPGSRLDLVAKVVLTAGADHGHEITATVPPLTIDSAVYEAAPRHLLVIVGESESRSHDALCGGYAFDTRPRLGALAADSALVAFGRAYAPATSTVEAFKRIIGLWDGGTDGGKPWYEYPTFLQVMREAGYHTSWLSNQSEKGVYDNPITIMARLADDARWTNDGMLGDSYWQYDERVIGLLDSVMEGRDSVRRSLTVVHLMGSHVAYDKRFPPSRARFVAADYGELAPEQRQVVADYDNSMLYTDSVVSEILARYADMDAMAVYFSDHGQDLYDVDPDYFGHARHDNAASRRAAMPVPLEVWVSAPLRERRPDLIPALRRAASDSVNTSGLTEGLMRLTGLTIGE